MVHQLIAEFMGTALMIIFGVGVHCSSVLKGTKYRGSGHIFAITTWVLGLALPYSFLAMFALTRQWFWRSVY